MKPAMLAALVPAAILAGFLINAVINAIQFPRLKERSETDGSAQIGSSVAVLIPARNEGKTIESTIGALLHQNYVNYKIVLLDDGSSDGTGIRATSAARKSPGGMERFQLTYGAALPAGWCGKNWACAQLAERCESDILIFTDADVRWSPGALAAVVDAMEEQRADLLTIWPTQETVTWAERLVVPLMAFSVMAYLPLRLANDNRYPSAAAANGQCLAFRRDAYRIVDGHAAVADRVLEDVELARRVKRAGLTLRMADAAGLLRCRMYRGWAEVRNGYAKNILAGHGDSALLLLLSTLIHFALFVAPWLWLGGRLGTGAPLTALIAPALLIAMGVSSRAVSAAATGQRVGDALLMPLSVLLMTVIAGQALWWQVRYGGPRWKDRTVKSAAGDAGYHLLPPQS